MIGILATDSVSAFRTLAGNIAGENAGAGWTATRKSPPLSLRSNAYRFVFFQNPQHCAHCSSYEEQGRRPMRHACDVQGEGSTKKQHGNDLKWNQLLPKRREEAGGQMFLMPDFA